METASICRTQATGLSRCWDTQGLFLNTQCWRLISVLKHWQAKNRDYSIDCSGPRINCCVGVYEHAKKTNKRPDEKLHVTEDGGDEIARESDEERRGCAVGYISDSYRIQCNCVRVRTGWLADVGARHTVDGKSAAGVGHPHMPCPSHGVEHGRAHQQRWYGRRVE